MLKNPRFSLAAVLAIAVSSTSVARAAEVSELSAAEFKYAAYFKDALEHPEVAKLKNRSAQIGAVAKDLKIKPKELEKALSKMEELGGDPESVAKAAEKAVKEAADGSRVKGKLIDVLVNAEEPKHVVIYVRWQGTSSREVVKEAATIANLVATSAPLVSTLSLAAIPSKAPRESKDSVWSGKISAESMRRIQKDRIEGYGDRLYKPLFEQIEEKPF